MSTLVLLLLWAFGLGATLWGTVHTLRKCSGPYPSHEAHPEPVTILKPLKGLESDSYAVLESFFLLDYPRFEILFSIDSPDDPILPTVEKLRARYPGVGTRIFLKATPLGPNPKINNIWRAYHEAKYDVVLISDSNVQVEPDYLTRLAPLLTEKVGIVTAVVAGRQARDLGASLEGVYLNTFYARWMLIADAIGRTYVIGKTMLFRRSTAARIGGLRYLSRYIAEDYQAGLAFNRIGLKTKLFLEPVAQHLGHSSFGAFWKRHLRWGRIRKSQVPLIFLLEPLHSVVLSGVVGALGVHALGFDVGRFALMHGVAWLTADMLMMRRLAGKLDLASLSSWLLRELLAFPLWLHMAAGSTILWRGNHLKILPGGYLDLGQVAKDETRFSVGHRNEQSPDRRGQHPQRLVAVGGPGQY